MHKFCDSKLLASESNSVTLLNIELDISRSSHNVMILQSEG